MPNIFQRIFSNTSTIDIDKEVEKRAELSQQFSSSNPIYGTLNFSSLDTYTVSKSLKLSVVNRSVNIIADSIAVMPIFNYSKKGNWWNKNDNTLNTLLNVAPNEFMSAFTLKKQAVQNLLLNGNAYIKIGRDSQGQVNELVLLDPNTINVIAVNGDIKYAMNATSYYNLPVQDAQIFDKSDIIHIMNFSLNNFVGISTLNYANLVLGTAYSAEVQANNYFSSNGILTGVIKPSAGNHLTQDKASSAKNAFLTNLNAGLNSGGNSVIVLDSGFDYQSIQTSPKDSMLIESREYSALQVAQFFGVPPSKLFLSPKSSAGGNEAEQIEFLNNTLLPLIEKIEAEITRKIVMPVDYSSTKIKFDTTNLLRLDASTQADVFTKYFNIGVYSTNEIRQALDCDYPVPSGNRHFTFQNVQPLDANLNDIKAGKVTPADNNNITTSGGTKQ